MSTTDRFDRAVRARIAELRETEPEKAAKLEAAFNRFREAEEALEEQAKFDRLRESRMRAYGVID